MAEVDSPTGAFYAADGDRFESSAHTTGPWSPDHQHAGPPAALCGRALERALGDGWFLAQLIFEIPRPVPVAPLTIEVSAPEGGRRVQRASAVLYAGDREVMNARCTAIRRVEIELPELPPLSSSSPPPPLDTVVETPFPFFRVEVGYHTAMEIRVARGGFGHRETAAWMRARLPLVDGEIMSPLQRVLIAADSGNGVSNVLDARRYLFVNPDLAVHLHREPEGEWICLDAYTTPETHGAGLAHSRLHDQRGPIGHAVQSLLVAPRD